MKRTWILGLLLPLLLAATRPPLVGVTSAPAGACNTSEIWVVFATGAQYQCVTGTWTLSSDPIVSSEIDTSAEIAAIVTDETGSGALCFATSPTLVTPVLGTPSSCTLTNCTGLPISTGVSGLGTGVATFLATPSSANFASAITDETGTGAAVLAVSPALTTNPTCPTQTVQDSDTSMASTAFVNAEIVADLDTSAELKAILTDETGSGLAVFATSPTFTTPLLGTPTSGNLVNCTGYSLTHTDTKDQNIDNPVTGDTNKNQLTFGATATIARIWCSTDTGTVSINFDERAEATPNTAGTNTLSSALVCDTDSQATTTFADSSIALRVPYNLQVTATSGAPTIVRIHVEWTQVN